MNLALKYVRFSWRNSLTLAVFLFALGLLLVLAQSFAYSASRQMKQAVVNSLTGHLQFLAADNPEKDMADVFSTIWQNKHPLEPGQTQDIVRAVAQVSAETGIAATSHARLRLSAMVISDAAKSPSMV